MSYPSFLESKSKKSHMSSTPVLPLHHTDKLYSNNNTPSTISPISTYKKTTGIDTNYNEDQIRDFKNYKTSYHTNTNELVSQNNYQNYKFENYRKEKHHLLQRDKNNLGSMKKSMIPTYSKHNDDYVVKQKQLSLKQQKIQNRRAPRASMPNIMHDQEQQFLSGPVQNPKNTVIKEAENPVFKKKTSQITSFKKDFKERMLMRKSSIDINHDWRKQISPLRKQKKKTFSLNDFEKIKDLGSGKYGQVFLAKQKCTNMVCALKIIEKKQLKDEQITQQFIRQLKIQLFLNHPNIVKMYGFFDDHVNIYIILEVGMGGQLFKQLKKREVLSEQKVANLMRQVCQAVCELHSQSIIHRDIKPENIVMHQNIVKLCDFGWSVHRDEKLRSTFCGTPLYVCPEILKGKQYDQKIDIWSLGVMMYEMLIGQNPFKIAKQDDLIKIVKQKVVIPEYAKVSPEAESFLFCCLQKNPDDRKNIRQLLNHDFFKKNPDKNDKKVGM